MAKQLSQEEIDILLNVRDQMSATEDYDLEALEHIVAADTEQKITAYNFKRPRLFAQDQMRVLNHLHESFARDLSVYLSAQLRTIVDISLTAVDQVLYSEYVMSSAPPSAIYVVGLEELEHRMIFEWDPRLVVYTVEKLFGGPGEFLKRPRPVSQIEQRIMGKVMIRALKEVESAWKQVFEMTLQEETFESNAEFVQIIPGVEPAIVCTFEVTVYEQRSFINICYPYLLLERLLGHTGMRQWISSATEEVPPSVRKRYEARLRQMTVELRAELGSATLPVTELMQLQVGDVIPLNRRVADPISVCVGQVERFAATPGQAGKRRALRIEEVVLGLDEEEFIPVPLAAPPLPPRAGEDALGAPAHKPHPTPQAA